MNQASLTRSLIYINAGVFLLMAFANVTSGEDYIAWGANFGPLTTGGQPWRLATSMFVHIGFLHLFVNMLALWNLGGIVEGAIGTLAFAVLYALSGIAGSIMSVWWHPEALSAGASGAIFGLFGGLIGIAVRRYFISGFAINRRFVRSMLFNILLNLGISLLPGIDFAAHAGGFVSGLILGAVMDPEPLRTRWWQHPLAIAMYGSTLLTVWYVWVVR